MVLSLLGHSVGGGLNFGGGGIGSKFLSKIWLNSKVGNHGSGRSCKLRKKKRHCFTNKLHRFLGTY